MRRAAKERDWPDHGRVDPGVEQPDDPVYGLEVAPGVGDVSRDVGSNALEVDDLAVRSGTQVSQKNGVRVSLGHGVGHPLKVPEPLRRPF
jgi:hypothetical protein